jgi:hypothetical protein
MPGKLAATTSEGDTSILSFSKVQRINSDEKDSSSVDDD